MADEIRASREPQGWTWRDRARALARVPAILDPVDVGADVIEGVDPAPTAYVRDQLLISTAQGVDTEARFVVEAARQYGWVASPVADDEKAPEAARFAPPLAPSAVRLETQGRRQSRVTRFALQNAHESETAPEPPAPGDGPSPSLEPRPLPDAWRVLQRARRLARSILPSVGLDHVLTLDAIGANPFTSSNPFTRSNPFTSSNPFTGSNPFTRSNPAGPDSYALVGSGGRQPVAFVGARPPRRTDDPPAPGRRPRVAVLDTGCGAHDWLDDVVSCGLTVGGATVGEDDTLSDPENYPSLFGVLDGTLDPVAGHGTFIAGLVHQACPDADILAIRVADGLGTVDEHVLIDALEGLLAAVESGFEIDVLNLSLGYYHETPQDGQYSIDLFGVLADLRARGVAVVCSAGNDSTDRPAFPAALWPYPGAEDERLGADDALAPHLAIGALNPSGASVALFSNIGPWVHAYALGAGVLSTTPAFLGGTQAGTRDDRHGRRRETIDPDDFRGGFALWSGTSFAAPLVAGRLAARLTHALREGGLAETGARVKALRAASAEVLAEFEKRVAPGLRPEG